MWEDFSVRVYNFTGRGVPDRGMIEGAERNAQGSGFPPGPPRGPFPPDRNRDQAGDSSGAKLPYAIERMGDDLLAALTEERHKEFEGFLKGGPPGPPGPLPPFRN